MKINMPVELLNEDCLKCHDMDISADVTEIWGNAEIVNRDVNLYCSHLNLCKRLRDRFKEENNDESDKSGTYSIRRNRYRTAWASDINNKRQQKE